MDEELKAYLTDMKRDMTALKGDMTALKSDMADMKSELIQHTETVETRLLGEFWKWARTADMRYRQGDAAVGFLNDRVQGVEDRVAELERRKAG